MTFRGEPGFRRSISRLDVSGGSPVASSPDAALEGLAVGRLDLDLCFDTVVFVREALVFEAAGLSGGRGDRRCGDMGSR